jgi:plastocyanin
MKKLFVFCAGIVLLAMLFAACSNGSSNNSGSSNSTPTVHMGASNFDQASVTVQKGQSLTLVDDTASVHIIMNGSWVNGAPQPKQEAGAPKVDVQFNGNDTHAIGPFNTAGTYHLYCTVHPGMNLTVIVE